MLHTQAHNVLFFRSNNGASDSIGKTAHQVAIQVGAQATALVYIDDFLRIQGFSG